MLTTTITRTDGSEESQPASPEALALWARFPLIRYVAYARPARIVLRGACPDRGLVVDYCWSDGRMVPFWVPRSAHSREVLVGLRRWARDLWTQSGRGAPAATRRIVLSQGVRQPAIIAGRMAGRPAMMETDCAR